MESNHHLSTDTYNNTSNRRSRRGRRSFCVGMTSHLLMLKSTKGIGSGDRLGRGSLRLGGYLRSCTRLITIIFVADFPALLPKICLLGVVQPWGGSQLIFSHSIQMDDYQRPLLPKRTAPAPSPNPTAHPSQPQPKPASTSSLRKAAHSHSRSKEKQIITSFRHTSPPPAATKSNCQSEYYLKTAETQREGLPLLDELRLKDNQLQLLGVRLEKSQFENQQLRAELKVKTEQLGQLQAEMQEILARSYKQMEIQQLGTDLAYECERYRQDQKRLLKMLETTAEYRLFAQFAQQDGGIDFLAVPHRTRPSLLDNPVPPRTLHFCSCQRDMIDELSFWVPQKAMSLGKEFVRERKGELTESELQLLLYELNRVWREREKRIVNTLQAQRVREVEKERRSRGK